MRSLSDGKEKQKAQLVIWMGGGEEYEMRLREVSHFRPWEGPTPEPSDITQSRSSSNRCVVVKARLEENDIIYIMLVCRRNIFINLHPFGCGVVNSQCQPNSHHNTHCRQHSIVTPTPPPSIHSRCPYPPPPNIPSRGACPRS